jgi:hypothetical protein
MIATHVPLAARITNFFWLLHSEWITTHVLIVCDVLIVRPIINTWFHFRSSLEERMIMTIERCSLKARLYA